MLKLLKGLYAITQASNGNSQRLLNDVQGVLEGGASIVQYRDKSDDKSHKQYEAEQILSLCRDFSVPLIINDDVDLAKYIGAAGVHIGKQDAALQQTRKELGPQAIIGVSCYNSLRLAEEAEAAGADYVAFGSFFSSPTKPEAVKAELSLLHSWSHRKIPVCAIGGITLENATDLIDAGADMLAVISGLWEATDIEQEARLYSQLFKV